MYAFGDKKIAIFLYYLKRLGRSELTKFTSWVVCHGMDFVSLLWPNGKCHRNSKMSLWTLICVHLLWNYQKLKSARIREKILLTYSRHSYKSKIAGKITSKNYFLKFIYTKFFNFGGLQNWKFWKKIDISAKK